MPHGCLRTCGRGWRGRCTDRTSSCRCGAWGEQGCLRREHFRQEDVAGHDWPAPLGTERRGRTAHLSLAGASGGESWASLTGPRRV